MRRLSVTLGFGLFAAAAPLSAAWANPDFLSAESVAVTVTKQALPSGVQDPAWDKVPFTPVQVASQRTVLMIDRDANTHREDPPVMVQVRALVSGPDLAVHLRWSDKSPDRAAYGETHSFGDSVALEMPLKFGAGLRLPYVGMGDPEAHVLISMQRAIVENQLGLAGLRKGTYVGAGFGSLTRAELPWIQMDMQYDSAAQVWNATFLRNTQAKDHSTERPLVPFAIAIWNGSKDQRGGNKMLSRWRVLLRSDLPAEPDYLKELSYGYLPEEVGNPLVGKAMVDAICAACHRFADKRYAPPQLAPDLSNIGVISTASYLRDSITAPSQVIVPVLNLNRHYQKSATPDKFGAYPNDMTYQWFTPGPEGTRTSRMPPFAFPPDQVANIIAYLRTLGVPPTAPAGAQP